MKTKTIKGKKYVALDDLKEFLIELLYNDGEVKSKKWNDGWDRCIDSISDEFDFEIYKEKNEKT